MDVPVPDDLPQGQAAKATATKTGSPTLTWVTLAMMTTASVASLRSAPTMAVYGLACVFLYLVPAGVDPSEIRTMALVEALFLLGYASAR